MLTLYVLYSSRFYLGSALMITIILTSAVILTLNYSLQWAVPFSPQNCEGAVFWGDRERCRSHFAWGICTSSNTRFLRPTRVHNSNGISIGLAVLQGSRLWQMGRRTNRPDHATIGCICVVLRCGIMNIVIMIVIYQFICLPTMIVDHLRLFSRRNIRRNWFN